MINLLLIIRKLLTRLIGEKIKNQIMERHISRGIEIALSDRHADIKRSKHVAFLFVRGQKRNPVNIGVNSKSKGMTANNFISCHAEINATFTGRYRHTFKDSHKKGKCQQPNGVLPRQWVQQRYKKGEKVYQV